MQLAWTLSPTRTRKGSPWWDVIGEGRPCPSRHPPTQQGCHPETAREHLASKPNGVHVYFGVCLLLVTCPVEEWVMVHIPPKLAAWRLPGRWLLSGV